VKHLLWVVAVCGGPAATAREEFAKWAPKDADKLWQGAWVMKFADDGPLLAVNIVGDKATVYDGRTEAQYRFSVIEPCAIQFAGAKTASPGSAGARSAAERREDEIEMQFLIRDGQIVVGRGAVAYRRGETAIACGDGRDPGAPEEGVYTVSGNHCTTWKRDATGAWWGRDGVCVWANARGEDLLEVGTEHYLSSMVLVGDIAMERDFKETAKDNIRAASWDEAKAAALAKAGPVTPLELAKAAGGSIGNTKSIAGVVVTYAEHPASLVGADIELEGTYVEQTTNEAHKKVKTTFAVITDTSKLQLTCQVDGAVKGIAAGDRVIVKGGIDTSKRDEVRLEHCTIKKL